ncbi:MAG: hypothetical protein A2W35_09915 [Chloroflexi bacterium RBG_16_57_11]|nr:MAG: hypothetical protein A2W35_09915 [Chloroflexi bacterium RBG_16_57_11]
MLQIYCFNYTRAGWVRTLRACPPARCVIINPMLDDKYNYLKLSESIATSGQPSEAQFAEIAQAGYQLVINLAALPDGGNA